MDPNGNIYAAPNPRAEDVARLDGYVRGLGAHDDDTAEQMREMRERFELVQAGAETDRLKAHLNEQLRREAQEQLLAQVECPECGATVGHAAECPIGLGLR